MSDKAKGIIKIIVGLVLVYVAVTVIAFGGEAFIVICSVIFLGAMAIAAFRSASEDLSHKQQSNVNKDKNMNKDINVGTQYVSEEQATTAWMAQHMNKDTPVIICRFPDYAQAKKAILSLSFIKEAEGRLISKEVVDYGCYQIKDGRSEVMICGHGFKKSKFDEAKKKLTEAGGEIYSEKSPKVSQPEKSPSTDTEVTFVRKSSRELAKGIFATYMNYKAKSEEAALAFLNSKSVTQNLYYIVVDTPQGAYGKDINGVYKE